MRTASSRSLIRRISSMPLLFLSEMSMIATSGRADASRVKAPGRSSASPHTSRSGCVAMCIANPSRTTGWSSTIRTFALAEAPSGFFFDIAFTSGEGTGDSGAAPLRRADFQNAADPPGAVLHDAETKPVGFLRHALDADAVIPDTQPQAVGLGEQGQANVSRPSVAEGIADRLLSDVEQLRGRRMIGQIDPLRTFGRNRDAGRRRGPGGQVI